MKHLFTFLLLLVFAHTAISQKHIESFDVPIENSDYEIVNFVSNDSTWISHSKDTLNVYEGKASLKIEYNIKSLESWGSSTTLATLLPSGNWDFSGYDKITFNLYNEVKPSAGSTYLQFMVYDNSEFPAGNTKEFWIAYLWPFDLEPGWNTITVPLKDVGSTAKSTPGSGFWLSTTAGNLGNEKLDLDKIKGVGFSIVATGPADGRRLSGTFLVDNLMLIGEVPSASGEELVESFEVPLEDTDYRIVNFKSNDNSGITQSPDTSNVYEGEAALKMEYSIRSLEDWGSASTLSMQWSSEINYWDFSGYDSISFYLYNEVKSSVAGRAKLQFILNDKSDFGEDGTDNRREFWFSYLSPFDLEPGWYKITIPLKDVGPAAQSNPGSGFWLSGAAGHLGNEKLDLDKISGVGFSVTVAGPANGADISGTFLVDKLRLVGKNTTTGVNTLQTISDGYSLEQNYPNPFQNETTLKFKIPKQAKVKLNVFDLSGKEVAVLVNGKLSSGDHKVLFSAQNLPSGVYYYRLQAGEFLDTKKLIVSR